MNLTLSAIQTVGLTSFLKPLVVVALLLVWARWATVVDKDAMYYFQNRRMWNTIQVVSALLAMVLIMLIPTFYLGLPLALIIIAFAGGAYVLVRNREVPEDEKWRFDKDFFIQMIQERREKKELKKAVLQFTSPPAGLKNVPMPEDAEREPHLYFEQVMENALRRHAQKLHLTGNDQQFQAQISIDGVDYSQGTLDAVSTMGMIDYLKAHAKMDVANRRKKQIGDVNILHEEFGEHLLRVHTAGSTRGLTCTVEMDPQGQLAVEFEKLGFLEPQIKQLEPIFEEEGGVVIVSCPPGHGRTTTLYSLAERHDPYTMDIHTLEPRIERVMEGVKQKEIKRDEMSKTLHSLFLRDPQVVLCSDCHMATDMQSHRDGHDKTILPADDATCAECHVPNVA
ncbi:MAG: ATPase, T2SS/T4P/T4SS family, partial [Phycisphaeraceae bacterium]|nr:ATPase, T2SS/T4P/T4SS family [Phycisphaeraceae bacterium]